METHLIFGKAGRKKRQEAARANPVYDFFFLCLSFRGKSKCEFEVNQHRFFFFSTKPKRQVLMIK